MVIRKLLPLPIIPLPVFSRGLWKRTTDLQVLHQERRALRCCHGVVHIFTAGLPELRLLWFYCIQLVIPGVTPNLF